MMEPVKFKNPRILVTQNPEFEDNISKLPDDLISHILSLMPTKFAVRTSILSNRWKYLWTNITNLDFNRQRSSNSLDLDSFLDFVDRVLQLCKPSRIQLFRLRYSGSRNRRTNEFFTKWISQAVRLNPSEIVIDVAHNAYYPTYCDYVVPLSLFTCETLTILKISSFASTIPNSVYLPNLKILSITSIDQDLLQMFIYGCPVLEHLSTGWILGKNRCVFNMSTKTMKELRFGHCAVVEMFKIVINAPNLESLDVTNALKFHVEDLQSLVEASLRLDGYYIDGDEYDDWKTNSDRVIEILRAVSDVKSLSLHVDSKYIEYKVNVKEFLHGAKLPTFHNLTSLEMVFTEDSTCKFLPQFLVISPNLRCLSLAKTPRYKQQSTEYVVQVQFVSGFSLLRLEEIKLKGFEGSKDDLAVVKYLLRDAMILKRLKVIFLKECADLTLEQERECCTELLKLRKTASNCKIEFHGHHVQIPSFQVDLIENNLFVIKSLAERGEVGSG